MQFQGRLCIILSVIVTVALLCLLVFAGQTRQEKMASLEVRIVDAVSGRAVPARVKVVDSKGDSVPPPSQALALPGTVLGLPEEAIAVMYGRGDYAEGFSLQPDGSFYVNGKFTLHLVPGRYKILISRGYEFEKIESELLLETGQSAEKTFRLKRWIDMPSRNWYSSDDHIHLRRSPRENPLIIQWTSAEDIHVANLLQMGDFWTGSYFAQYAFGKEGRYREGDYLLISGQEDPRTFELGHTISLAADELVRQRDQYYLYDTFFDRVHELNGITGYAHQAMSFHGYRGLTLDLPQDKIDFLELLQFCVVDEPLHLKHYYHYLDLGFPLTATAGSDFPWCGRGPAFGVPSGCSQIGDARFYTRVDPPFDFDSWLSGVKEGRTFVTSGPMLFLTVNGQPPGTLLEIDPGETVQVYAEAYGLDGQVPLTQLQLVAHGDVLAESGEVVAMGEGRQKLEISLDLEVSRGLWLAARGRAGKTQVAHTTPVYLDTGQGFINPKTAPEYLALSEAYLQEIEQVISEEATEPYLHAFRYRGKLEDRILQTRKILEQIKVRLNELQ